MSSPIWSRGRRFNELLRILRPEGRYTTAGAIGGALVELDLRTLYLKQLQLHGSSQGRRGDFQNILGYIRAGKIRPLLAGSYPLSRLREAQEDFKAKRFVGKLVVIPDSKLRDGQFGDRVPSRRDGSEIDWGPDMPSENVNQAEDLSRGSDEDHEPAIRQNGSR